MIVDKIISSQAGCVFITKHFHLNKQYLLTTIAISFLWSEAIKLNSITTLLRDDCLLYVILLRSSNSDMEPRSFADLLGFVNDRMVGVTTLIRKPQSMSVLYAYEHVFEEYTRPSEQLFINGINIHFMKTLRELQRLRPVVFTSEYHAQPRVLVSDKPITVHHTGSNPVEVGHRFTVIPPLCNVPRATKFNNRYLLQTVDYELFKLEFQQLCVWLRLFGELKWLIANEAVTNSSEYWRRVHLATDEKLRGNTLWEDMSAAVQRDQKVENGGHICKMIADVSERHWYPYIVMNDYGNFSLQKPFLTTRHVYDDLKAGLEAVDQVDTDAFRQLGSDVVDDDNDSAVALKTLISNQMKILEALHFIGTYSDVFTPIEVGKIQGASSSVIKPGDRMNVMLSCSQSTL